jgi:8-oxo-dGTP pyrophosphatase MutT (NUDIX family)
MMGEPSAHISSPVPTHRPDIDERHNPWITTSTAVRYENPWISVRHDEVVDPSGRPGIYGVVTPKNLALGVLPIFDDGSVLLVGQYRYALSKYSWEMPEGGGAPGIDPLESIARELREETGHEARAWHPLYDITLSNSVADERALAWVAWDLHPLTEGAEPESTEDLAHWRVPFAEVVAMVWAGEIHDSMTATAVSMVEAQRLRAELPVALQRRLAAQ